LQENIEGDSFSPILRLKPAADRPPFHHPRKSGDPEEYERRNRGKLRGNAINRNVPDLGSRFRGNDEKKDCVESRIQKKFTRDDLSDFVAVYLILLQEVQEKRHPGRWRSTAVFRILLTRTGMMKRRGLFKRICG
jgi:hypothetical protein